MNTLMKILTIASLSFGIINLILAMTAKTREAKIDARQQAILNGVVALILLQLLS